MSDNPKKKYPHELPHEKPLTKKQKDFLKVLESSMGIISTACKKFGIDRKTHYDWSINSTYKNAVEDINQRNIDFAESKLLQHIKNDSETSLIFYLKCKGKNRGYIERVQNETVNYEGKGLPAWFGEA